MASARDTSLSINMVMNSAINGANFLQASVKGIHTYAKAVETVNLLKATRFGTLKNHLSSLDGWLGKIQAKTALISRQPLDRMNAGSARDGVKERLRIQKAIEASAKQTAFYSKMDAQNNHTIATKQKRRRVSSIGAGGVMGTAMMLAPTVLPLKGAVGFESAMLRVKAISGSNGADFKSMESKALELGAKTEYKSTEVAQGMQFLSMAGFKPKEVNQAMKGVLNLATAGDIDLKSTADISSNILGGFELPAKKMNMVADIMAKTITTANVDIRMFGDSMKYAAPIAKKAGMSLSETSAMAGLLGNIGIQGTMAGTTLKSIITRLSAPPTEAKKVLSALHIQTADKNGHLKSIPLLLQELYTKTKGAGNAKQLEYFKKVFGLEPLAGGTKLIDLAGKGELKKYISIVNDYKGTAERIAGIQLSGVEGSMKLLGSAFDNLSIKMSRAMLPELKDYIKIVTNGVNRVEAWASAHPKLASNLYKTALALGVGTLALATFGFVASGVASAVGFLSMPLIAVAGVATAGVLLWQDYGNGLVFVKGALNGAREGLDDILELAHGVGEIFSGAKKEVVSFAQSVGLLSSDTKSDLMDSSTAQSFGKFAVYGAGIYGSIKVLKMLKGALFGVSKASKGSCGSLGCIGTSAQTNSKTATGALGAVLNKVKSLALFLRANPIVIGITLAGAGVAYLNSKTFKSIGAKHLVGLNEQGLVKREAYLKERLESMKKGGVWEHFIHGSPNKYKIAETERLLHRVENKLHYVRTVGVAPTIIKPSNNPSYKSVHLQDIKDGVGEKLPLNSLLKQSESFKSEVKSNSFTNSKTVHQTIGNVNIHIKSTDGIIDEHELQRQVMRAIKNSAYEDKDTQMKDAV